MGVAEIAVATKFPSSLPPLVPDFGFPERPCSRLSRGEAVGSSAAEGSGSARRVRLSRLRRSCSWAACSSLRGLGVKPRAGRRLAGEIPGTAVRVPPPRRCSHAGGEPQPGWGERGSPCQQVSAPGQGGGWIGKAFHLEGLVAQVVVLKIRVPGLPLLEEEPQGQKRAARGCSCLWLWLGYWCEHMVFANHRCK